MVGRSTVSVIAGSLVALSCAGPTPAPAKDLGSYPNPAGGITTLTDLPCPLDPRLRLVRASSSSGGKSEACWTIIGSHVIFVDRDGDVVTQPAQEVLEAIREPHTTPKKKGPRT